MAVIININTCDENRLSLDECLDMVIQENHALKKKIAELEARIEDWEIMGI